MKIGFGYDAHRLVEGRKLILAGVEVPYEKGLLGHSDADVIAHALADALLGAGKLGDIGAHFPDTDPKYKNADSLVLLSEVAKLLSGNRFKILDVDCCLLAENPKISPYRAQMRENLANALGLEVNSVGLKATTTEQMGFVGSGEGMAAYAVALIDIIT